jgi:calcineurin-like phosphoesterase
LEESERVAMKLRMPTFIVVFLVSTVVLAADENNGFGSPASWADIAMTGSVDGVVGYARNVIQDMMRWN